MSGFESLSITHEFKLTCVEFPASCTGHFPRPVGIEYMYFKVEFAKCLVKVGVLLLVQQPGSHWDRSQALPLVELEPTERTAFD